MRLPIIYKTFALALIATLAVSCEMAFDGSSDVGTDPQPPNKIVIPINPRPKYPGGIIKEPRIIDNNFTFEIYRPSKSAAYSVTVRSVATGKEYHHQISSENYSVVVPYSEIDTVYEVQVECGEERYVEIIEIHR